MKNVKHYFGITAQAVILAMALAFVPAAANAAGEVCEIGAVQYTDLGAALAAVPTGGASPTVIRLLDNITYDPGAVTAISNRKITFDLNAHDLIFANKLRVESGSAVDYTGDGLFEVNYAPTDAANNADIDGLYVDGGSSVRLTGVTITDSGTGTNRWARMECRDGASVTVDGDVTVTGNGNTGSYSEAVYATGGGAEVTVRGNITAAGSGTGVRATVGATVTAEGTITADAAYIQVGAIVKTPADVTIPTTRAGFLTYTDGTSVVWVADFICEIGAVQYNNLGNAIAAVPSGGATQTVIRLLDDITYALVLVISNRKITFDLNGHDLIIANTLGVNNGSNVDYTGIGKFEVNKIITGRGNGGNYFALYLQYGSSIRLTGVTITDNGTGGDFRALRGIYCYSSSSVTVDGNVSSTGNGMSGSYNHAIYTFDSGNTVTVNGNVSAANNGTGVLAGNGSTVTVNGTITADANYIRIQNTPKTAADFTIPTTKPGYLTYTDGSSTVWVSDGAVCAIGDVQYTDLGAALAAVPTGGSSPTVIRLIKDITYDPGAVTSISNKKITFNLNGNDLIFANKLRVESGSIVGYTGSGLFEVNYAPTGGADIDGLYVDGGSSVRLTGVTITDNGAGNGHWVRMECRGGSTVTVDGDVTVTGNGAGSTTEAVYATGAGSEVTVYGNITAAGNGTGVRANAGATVTVEGIITSDVTYIQVGAAVKTPADVTIPTTKAGYLTYTDGASAVWVAVPVCEIVATGKKYNNIEKAINAAPTGGSSQTVIRLLDNITHASASSTQITNRRITFDLNGHDLIFTNYLGISNSNIDYTGTGKFELNHIMTGSTSSGYFFANGLSVYSSGAIRLTGVTVTDSGTGTSRTVRGINCSSNSTVTVDGNVSATGNGESSSSGHAIYASGTGTSVTVNGNISAANNGIGVLASGTGTSVTVNGNISAANNGTGVLATGTGTTVTVNGTISADANYIRVGSTAKTPAEVTNPTTKPGYLTYTDGFTTVWVYAGAPVAPVITGDATLTLTEGYAATSTGAFTVTGAPALTVALTSAYPEITWNGVTGTINIAPGLTAAGSPYAVTLTASNGIAAMDATHTFTLTVQAPTVPDAPTGVSAVAGNAQATVTFTAPASDGGSPITGYTVTSSPGGNTATGAGSPITVTGLSNGTVYTFTVIATNAIGNSAPSAPSNPEIPFAPAVTVPGAPTGVSAVAGNGQATVAFTPPASDGGSPVTGYTVTSSPGGITATGAGSPITVPGLTNGTAYTFTVTAANAIGNSASSAASASVTPTAPATTAPTITSADSASAVSGTGGAFQVTATGTGPITYGLTGTVPAGVTVNAATGLITIAATTAQGTYNFTVTASNGTPPDASQAFTLTVTAPVTPPAPVSYAIHIGSFAGGSVRSSHTTAQAGTTVTLTATPSAGYELSSMGIYPSGGLNGTGNVRTFTMPAANVTVSAVFAKMSLKALWESVMSLVENTVFTVAQADAPDENALRYHLAGLINKLLEGTGFSITASDIVVYSFTSATAGSDGAPSGTNGSFGFRVTPEGTNTSAYSSGTITATPVGNGILPTQSLKAWTADGTLHVAGLTAGESWRVYSITGTLIYQGMAGDSGEAKQPLPARGVYIVAHGAAVIKVVN